MNPTDTIIALEKALEAPQLTAGPWQVVETQIPHKLGGHHVERRIFTTWDHPQLKGPLGVVNHSVGIGAEEGAPACHLVQIDAPDAAFIAAANPLAIRTLLDAHASALRDAKELRMARDAAVSAHEVVQLAGFHFRDEVLTLRRRMAKLKAALEEVCTVLETNVTAIVDTVWVSDGSPETLLDFCRAALDDNTKGAAE